jgi:hypothetical protein
MISRCYNPNNKHYKNYGAIGRTVCDRWLESFENFFEDMGECPEGMTLERIDNTMGYFKENCKWATCKEQNNNRRDNVWIEHAGVRRTRIQWARYLGLPVGTLRWRLDNGWSLERALTNPINNKRI